MAYPERGTNDNQSVHGIGLFDKGRLVTWREIAEAFVQENVEAPTFEDIIRYATRELIPIHSKTDYPGGVGFPPYVSSRIKFLSEIENKGWYEEELRDIADYEEWTIDNHQKPYINNDIDLLIQHAESFSKWWSAYFKFQYDRWNQDSGSQPDWWEDETKNFQEQLDENERRISLLKQFRDFGIPTEYQNELRDSAFDIRSSDESACKLAIQGIRSMVSKGFSPYIIFREYIVAIPIDISDYTPSNSVNWSVTISLVTALLKNEIPLFRVPGFLLQGEKILSTETILPNEYKELWEEYNFDEYLSELSKIQGNKRCQYCMKKLDSSSDKRRMYCSDQCRNAAKQKRYRERNPDAVIKHTNKYWFNLFLHHTDDSKLT